MAEVFDENFTTSNNMTEGLENEFITQQSSDETNVEAQDRDVTNHIENDDKNTNEILEKYIQTLEKSIQTLEQHIQELDKKLGSVANGINEINKHLVDAEDGVVRRGNTITRVRPSNNPSNKNSYGPYGF